MKHAATRAAVPIVRFVEWLFGPRLPGFDLAFGLLALGWATQMTSRPATYSGGRFAGMSWLPMPVWIGFFCALVVLHAVGARWPDWRGRWLALLLSAWVWLCVAVSFTRLEFSTATFVYGVVGLGALFGGIYLSGQPRNGG